VGTITVVQQSAPVESAGATLYALREVMFTKAGATTLGVDFSGPWLYTMASDGYYSPFAPADADFAGGMFAANAFTANALDLLVYGTHAPAAG